MLKQIGIVGWKTTDNSFGITVPYYNYFSQFGDVRILQGTNTIYSDLDLVVLPGGPDVSSYLYGQVPSIYNSNNDLFKEFFFKNNLHKYIENKVPVFGICLGMQQLNVGFGGSLVQNGNYNYSSTRTECKEALATTDCTEESLRTIYNGASSLMRELYTFGQLNSKKEFKVNSLHHQGVSRNKMSKEFKSIFVSKDFYNVEAFMHKELPIIGVQWHPEEIQDLFSAFAVSYLLNIKK